MKSEIIQEQPEDAAIEYPCLMQWKSGDLLVLFTSYTKGTVVFEGDGHSMGYYSNSWQHGNFKPFKGKLVLSND